MKSRDLILARELSSLGMSGDMDTTVELVNRIFHDQEAQDYDQRHPEISSQLPPIWKSLSREVESLRPDGVFRILGYGCGTGFATEMVLNYIDTSRISSISLFDISEEMLARASDRISTKFDGPVTATTNLEELKFGEIDFVITNSVLHHLIDPVGEMMRIGHQLPPGAIWVTGHEPSARYYRNVETIKVYEQFLSSRRYQRFVDFAMWKRKIRYGLRLSNDPYLSTARILVERKVFSKMPSRRLIDRIVDFHVAHDQDEVASGRGFDFEEMGHDLAGVWRLQFHHTYSFMGPYPEIGLKVRWKRVASHLAQTYPHDGANWSAVWSRE